MGIWSLFANGGRGLKGARGGHTHFLILLLTLAPFPAFGSGYPTYDDSFTFKNGKPFTVDPFVWAYTPEFAKKFEMPERWIERGFKGVLAAAWRMTTIGNVTCGYDSKADNCRRPFLCQMDIYYDSSLPLPWNYPEVMADNVWDGILSTSHLPDITNQKGIRRYSRDPSHPAGIMSSGGELLYGTRRPRAEIAYFDREFLPGIGLIGYVGLGVCPQPGTSGPATMEFHRPEDAKKAGGRQAARPLVVMEFPDRYLRRLSDAYVAQSRIGADITDRLLGQVSDWNGRFYRDVHAFKGEPYVRDPFIWAYSKEFAEKYRMPPEWIEPGLKGAQAIAWRMTTVGTLLCGLSRRRESCWPQLECQMDIYFDSAAPLPWNYPNVVRDDFMWGISSKKFLLGEYFQKERRRYRGEDLSKRPKPVMYSQGTIEYGKHTGGVGRLVYFDRNHDSSLSFLSYSGTCPSMKLRGPGIINYVSADDFERSLEIRVQTQKIDVRIAHAVELPEALLVRLKAAYSAGKGDVDRTLDRLIDDFQKSRR
jgi:hypothetical protein